MDAHFHPLVARWFEGRFAAPTPAQAAGWTEIARGRDVLIAAPTGSGKTLAAFLWAVDGLVRTAVAGGLRDETVVVYVSPLRALGNDIERNLHEPLAGIRALAASDGLALPEIRVAVRTGDTPGHRRTLMGRRPPHILITTPESLYILLTAERSRQWLRTARVVIVDEIHAMAADKRGAHLALSLERLDLLAVRRAQRIGLSATQRPIDEIARWLVGAERIGPDGGPDCAVIDVGHRRAWQLSIEVPQQPLGAIATHEHWAEIYDRLAALVGQHRSTLVFVHTRRLAERVAHQLTQRLGPGRVATHHGSLARRLRLDAEQRLKAGQVPVVVATASLELGIDIGEVDLVCHLGAPRALAQLLQRVGRSGHGVGAVPRGIVFPLTRDDLVQSAAAVRAVLAGELDRTVLPDAPLDVLAQQIVATVAAQEIAEDALWAMVRRAYPYRRLSRTAFEQVVVMLSEGIAARRGRAGAYLHRDRVWGMLRPRRGARLAAITSGGAIPDTADYDVREEPTGAIVGKVNEDFAIESQAGDIFLLGNQSWQIRRVEAGTVRVTNAHGAPPSIPFWLGEALGRTPELSEAVSALRERLAAGLADRAGTVAWLVRETGVDPWGAEQLVTYAAETVAALGAMPTQRTVVAERFFDEAGGMQLVIHAPFGSRLTRAWGLALRKRFCLTFDFELQAAATDDGIVLSLGEQHAFPLESVFAFVRTATMEADLVQALLASPLFTSRWRQNATRALAVLRHSGGRRVPMPIQRMRAEDLLAAVFPAQVACQDNHAGPVTPPDHPLVTETIRNGLYEAMDLEGLRAVIGALERGEIRTVAVETPAPSPASHEILHANPYAFLDDAPLEERRARAVRLRRVDPDLAAGVGALDDAAIAQVRAQAWPVVRDPDELYDLLLTVGLLPAGEARAWEAFARALAAAGRATLAAWRDAAGMKRSAWVAAERLPLARLALPDMTWAPDLHPPAGAAGGPTDPDAALLAIIHGWMQVIGPTTSRALAARLGVAPRGVEQALLGLEGQGAVLRGRFTPGADELEWCERRLLARIHRLTLGRLRGEIEPVAAADLMRFLFRWQHVHPGTRLHGRDGLLAVIGQLQGLEVPAPAWEAHVLPARMRAFDPADLEALCLAGTVTWGRLSGTVENAAGSPDGQAPSRRGRPPRPVRTAPLAFVLRDDLSVLLDPRQVARAPDDLSPAAREVVAYLRARGASFFTDIARALRRSPRDVEEALWELVTRGWVSGDGVAGLRRLLRGPTARGRLPGRLRRPGAGDSGLAADRSWAGWTLRMHARSLPTGRWALWSPGGEGATETERAEAWARQLLRRWGIVLRELLAREHAAPPWRALLDAYRRWETQGLVRGGRFVAGFVGEQFALPEAVEALRAVRRAPVGDEVVVIAAADPLNLLGIVLPGVRVPPAAGVALAFRDGTLLDAGPPGALLRRLQPASGPPLRAENTRKDNAPAAG
ncbi:MAG: DEAD/DEAH box helicase [Armatimonadota bacterium]|nr:DEAD/DEAH box helicase [Armatimonadota bacterium]MDR7534332.1 DEAD/DEAH box helicase [Armatimonadota bacterium]MDR7536908.1 DEAD/DEAH box helicase [Armatimonadota bacterium]